jgi:hypothetical protein
MCYVPTDESERHTICKEFDWPQVSNENAIMWHQTTCMAFDRSLDTSAGVLDSFRRTLAKLQQQATTESDRSVVTEFERILLLRIAELEAKRDLTTEQS